MDNVKIYNGQTEKEMFQEIEDVKKDYNDSLKQYKIQKNISCFGVALTAVNFLSFFVIIRNKNPLALIHGGYTVLCCITTNKNFKDLKNIKEKNKCLKLKLNSLEEKLPIESDYIVR